MAGRTNRSTGRSIRVWTKTDLKQLKDKSLNARQIARAQRRTESAVRQKAFSEGISLSGRGLMRGRRIKTGTRRPGTTGRARRSINKRARKQ